MHTMDLGLVKYFLTIVVDLCDEYSLIGALNQRLLASTTGQYRYGGHGLSPMPELSKGLVSRRPTTVDVLSAYYDRTIRVQ